MKSKKVNIIYIILFIYIIGILVLLYEGYLNLQNVRKQEFNFKSNFKSINARADIKAKSYVILDLQNNKILKAENENEILPLASLSKVISIGAYLDFKNKNNQAISETDLNLINKILIESDNEKMDNLADNFQKQNKANLLDTVNKYIVNNKSKLNSDNQVKMQNLTGLDIDDTTPGNISSAIDFALLYAQIYEQNKDIFEETKFTNINNLINTNKEVENTFGLMSSKTGFTDMAGGNLAVIVSPSPGQKYLIVILGSTLSGRFKDIEILNNLLPSIIKASE
jgi:D-alanyl-D-alanine carboxypeptidase